MHLTKLLVSVIAGKELGAHFPYLGICEFGLVMLFAIWTIRAAFGVHIHHIVFVRPNPKMGGIAASAIIAGVADGHVLWNGAISQFIGDATGAVGTIADLECAISALCSVGLPLPTFVWAAPIHLLPETFFEWAAWHYKMSAALMVSANVAAWLAFDISARCVIESGYWCKLTATALTVTVGYFLRGLFGGMLRHGKFSFQNLLMPPNGSNRCGGNFIDCYSCIIAQKSAISLSGATA